MPLDTKLRRQQRMTTSASIRVAWQDRLGRDKFTTVHSFDISPAGMRMELPEAVDPRTVVTLQSQELRLHGNASVRYCKRVSGHYVVGLEFLAGLEWKPPTSTS